MTKDLKSKAITIRGKKYVLVADRVAYFNDTYPNGSIITQLVSEPASNMVVMKANVTPDNDKPARFFTGYSQARWDDKSSMVNTTSALENCETSCVGRALAMMGIGIIDSIASADEIKKADVIYETLEKPATHPQNEFNKSRCNRCGGSIAISKAGKPYCQAKCWLQDNIAKQVVKPPTF